MKRFLPFILAGTLCTLLAAGCGAAGGEPVTPEILLANGVTHMAALPGFEFRISQDGAWVFLDGDETIEFSTAVGHYVSPDQAQTTVSVSVMGLQTEIEVISLQEIQWAKNPLTGDYLELPPEYLFKPTQYLDPEVGFFPSLGDGLTDLVLMGEEELEDLPGLTLTHLSGTLPGEVTLEISKGLIAVESMQGDLWMDAASHEVHRVVLTDSSAGEDNLSVWTFDFWSFGETIEISAP